MAPLLPHEMEHIRKVYDEALGRLWAKVTPSRARSFPKIRSLNMFEQQKLRFYSRKRRTTCIFTSKRDQNTSQHDPKCRRFPLRDLLICHWRRLYSISNKNLVGIYICMSVYVHLCSMGDIPCIYIYMSITYIYIYTYIHIYIYIWDNHIYIYIHIFSVYIRYLPFSKVSESFATWRSKRGCQNINRQIFSG